MSIHPYLRACAVHSVYVESGQLGGVGSLQPGSYWGLNQDLIVGPLSAKLSCWPKALFFMLQFSHKVGSQRGRLVWSHVCTDPDLVFKTGSEYCNAQRLRPASVLGLYADDPHKSHLPARLGKEGAP